MAVKIRLRRMGARGKPFYRVVVADSRSPRDGRFIALIGHYDPRAEPPTIKIDEEKALLWLSRGAQPSDTTRALLKKQGIIDKFQAAKTEKTKKEPAAVEQPPVAEEPKAEEKKPAPRKRKAAAAPAKPKAAKKPKAAAKPKTRSRKKVAEEPKSTEEPEAAAKSKSIAEPKAVSESEAAREERPSKEQG